jgi:uncharacterized membrane protein YcaP (DUF421 family)
MEALLRSAAVYVFLFAIFRVAGKRTLAQITPFDLVLLLIVGEATQQALLGDDLSVTNAVVVITSLIGIELAVTALQRRWPRLAKMLEGLPLVVVENGVPLEDRMRRARIDLEDVLEQARQKQGLERLDQIRYAVLERSGSISIIPKS